MWGQPRPWQRIAAAAVVVVALVFVVLAVHDEAAGPPETEMLEEIVAAIVRADPKTKGDREQFGDVSAVRCRDWGGGPFRGATVFLCDIEYGKQVSTFRCAAIVDGTLYTDASQPLRALDCVPRVGVAPLSVSRGAVRQPSD